MIPHPSMSGVQTLHNWLWTLSGNEGLWLLEDCTCLLAHIYQVGQRDDVGCSGSPRAEKAWINYHPSRLGGTTCGIFFSKRMADEAFLYKPFFSPLQRSVKEKRYRKREKNGILCETCIWFFFSFSEKVVLLRCISDYSSITNLARCISSYVTHLIS